MIDIKDTERQMRDKQVWEGQAKSYSNLFLVPEETVHLHCRRRFYRWWAPALHCLWWGRRHSAPPTPPPRILGAGQYTLSSGRRVGSRPVKRRPPSPLPQSRGDGAGHGLSPWPLAQMWAGCQVSGVVQAARSLKTRPGRRNLHHRPRGSTSPQH